MSNIDEITLVDVFIGTYNYVMDKTLRPLGKGMLVSYKKSRFRFVGQSLVLGGAIYLILVGPFNSYIPRIPLISAIADAPELIRYVLYLPVLLLHWIVISLIDRESWVNKALLMLFSFTWSAILGFLIFEIFIIIGYNNNLWMKVKEAPEGR